MKKYLFIILISTVISSCKKDDVVITHDRIGISKVTYYPQLTLNDGAVSSIVVGASFTDPGAKGTAGGQDVPVTTVSTVDANTVGVYTITYTATNTDGFSASAIRTVVVIPAAETPGVDLTGVYMTTSGTPNANITKVAPGVYYTDNCWGNGSLAIIPAYFICTDGAVVSIPLQTVPGVGRIETTMDGTYVGGLISWEIVRLDFSGGPLVRDKTWQKQ